MEWQPCSLGEARDLLLRSNWLLLCPNPARPGCIRGPRSPARRYVAISRLAEGHLGLRGSRRLTDRAPIKPTGPTRRRPGSEEHRLFERVPAFRAHLRRARRVRCKCALACPCRLRRAASRHRRFGALPFRSQRAIPYLRRADAGRKQQSLGGALRTYAAMAPSRTLRVGSGMPLVSQARSSSTECSRRCSRQRGVVRSVPSSVPSDQALARWKRLSAMMVT